MGSEEIQPFQFLKNNTISSTTDKELFADIGGWSQTHNKFQKKIGHQYHKAGNLLD